MSNNRIHLELRVGDQRFVVKRNLSSSATLRSAYGALSSDVFLLLRQVIAAMAQQKRG